MKEFWKAMLLPAIIIVGVPIVYLIYVPTDKTSLAQIFGIIVAVLIAAFAGVVLGKIANNDINIRLLISEDNGNASLSRFQFLLFTFVIAASYFLYVAAIVGAAVATHDLATLIKDGKIMLPDIPPTVLGLIGISGASYVVAKGIQKSSDAGLGVVRVQVNQGGAQYGLAPEVSFIGGGGAGAHATATVANGAVIAIAMTNNGTGYTTPPTVQIMPAAGDPGAGASATAVLG